MPSPSRYLDQIRLPLLSLVAGCLVACSIDLPTPIVVQKDTTVAFPCQTRGCGCKNADQCWKSCCCFSDAEKLAWGKANGVTAPAWFMEKMSAVKADGLASKPGGKNVVAKKPEAPAAKKSSCCCCCKSESNECGPAVQESDDDSAKVLVRLTLRQQRGCNGQLDYQLQHLVYLPLEIPVELPQLQFPHFAPPPAILTPVVLDFPSPPPRDLLFA